MSAMGGAIPVRLPGELEPAEIEPDGSGNGGGLGGIVIPLRVERQAPVERAGPPALELDPISPELALVDPELARAARALLPDVPLEAAHAAIPAAVVERLDTGLAPLPRGRLGRLLSVAGLIALGALLTLGVGAVPTRQQAQPVAGAAPAQATPTPTPVQKAAKPATPAALHAPALAGQTFVWVAAPGASGYEFQLFRSGERIFRTRVVKPRLVLPGRWRQDGRPYSLVPGDYRWYVWPVSSQTKRQSAVATVQAKLAIGGQPR